MNENLKTWRLLDRPPLSALKKIGGGRLAGKSDINPQWRYQAMTQVFGMCGIGWKYTIDKLWTEAGDNGERFAFAQVSVYTISPEGGWSDPIPATGGSMLVQREKSGLYNNDEAFKMATTDALGTALKMLGVAADVYMGNFDGSKYKDRPSEESGAKQKDGSPAATSLSQERHAKLVKEGAPILEAAAAQGMDQFVAAWKMMSGDMREACAATKDRLKAQLQGAANGK